MIIGYTGLPGCGKTYVLVEKIQELLIRNKKFFKDTGGIRRVIYTNVELHPDLIKKNKDYIKFFGEKHDITDLDFIFTESDIDIVFDEIGVYFDSTQWQNLAIKYRQWFALHEHYGVDIYFASQDFMMIDKSFRRMVTGLYWLKKLMGSARPSATKPKIKRIWGIIIGYEVDPKTYKEDEKLEKKKLDIFPNFWFINKQVVDNYNTRQKFKEVPRMLIHENAYCADPTCIYHHKPKIIHR